MQNDIKKISVSEDEIKKIVTNLGKQIAKDYEGRNPMFIGMLKGAVPFMTDLLKYVLIPCTVDYIKASSYSGTKSGSLVVQGNMPDVKGREVVVIDDILDTGRTLLHFKKTLLDLGAKSVKVCVLLDKPGGRLVDIQADYVGGLVPNEFVVGYGLDYNEKYRNLPFIGVLKEEIYK